MYEPKWSKGFIFHFTPKVTENKQQRHKSNWLKKEKWASKEDKIWNGQFLEIQKGFPENRTANLLDKNKNLSKCFLEFNILKHI